MNNNTNIQVWFLRHGKTPFNYEDSKYDDFIQMLCNGYSMPLAPEPAINFELLPQQVDFVGYSPYRRAIETAQILERKIEVTTMQKLEFLHEVKFDWDIIQPQEFTSLAKNRKDILERWYSGRNKKETMAKSLCRVREIEIFLGECAKDTTINTVVMITHGWLLRLLELYFVQGKQEPTLEELLNARPVPLGHCIKATITRKLPVGFDNELGDSNVVNSIQESSSATETVGRRARYLVPAIS